MDSLLVCLLMEHSVVTKGLPGCQTGAEEIPVTFHMLESFFHENRFGGIHFEAAPEISARFPFYKHLQQRLISRFRV
jgi:hypothetical protein